MSICLGRLCGDGPNAITGVDLVRLEFWNHTFSSKTSACDSKCMEYARTSDGGTPVITDKGLCSSKTPSSTGNEFRFHVATPTNLFVINLVILRHGVPCIKLRIFYLIVLIALSITST